jgi:hypothetical protein
MVYVILLLSILSNPLWSQTVRCNVRITSVSELDECLKSNNRPTTKSLKEILDWKSKLNISAPLSIEVAKIQDIVTEQCEGTETPKAFAMKVSKEVEEILRVGSLQIKDWRIPTFPEPNAKDYSMKTTHGCDIKDLFYQMKNEVEALVPDLMGVYNLGLALDTTSSQEQNLQVLAASIDAIYASIPANAQMSFVTTAYGDEFRGGLKFEGDKSYVLPRVKNFILSQRIHGGGTAPEFVYGGSYITSKNLGRAHGLIFNFTNASADNTQVRRRNGDFIPYTLRDLGNYARKNVHVIRNVFVKCR